MNTLAELKRKLQPEVKLILIERFGKKIENPQPRSVIKVQGNAIVIEKVPGAKNGSWLYWPPGSLIEITDRGFKIFEAGDRDLTPEEKAIRENEPRDPKQEEIDALSDGSIMFWRQKRYYKEKNALHLFGTETVRGMRYNYNTGKVRDNRVKGKVSLEYLFDGDNGNG